MAPGNESTLWGCSVCVEGSCNLLCIPKMITNMSLGTWAPESHFSLCASVPLYESQDYVFCAPWMNRASSPVKCQTLQSQVYHIFSSQPFKTINIEISHSKISKDCRSARLWNMNLSDFNGCDASLRDKISFNVVWKIPALQWQMTCSAFSVHSERSMPVPSQSLSYCSPQLWIFSYECCLLPNKQSNKLWTPAFYGWIYCMFARLKNFYFEIVMKNYFPGNQ